MQSRLRFLLLPLLTLVVGPLAGSEWMLQHPAQKGRSAIVAHLTTQLERRGLEHPHRRPLWIGYIGGLVAGQPVLARKLLDASATAPVYSRDTIQLGVWYGGEGQAWFVDHGPTRLADEPRQQLLDLTLARPLTLDVWIGAWYASRQGAYLDAIIRALDHDKAAIADAATAVLTAHVALVPAIRAHCAAALSRGGLGPRAQAQLQALAGQ